MSQYRSEDALRQIISIGAQAWEAVKSFLPSRPAYHAELCPVCLGSGKWRRPESVAEGTHIDIAREITCHGCDGKGYIEVRN